MHKHIGHTTVKMHSAEHYDTPVEASSNRVISSVGKKLKYYIEVKRREDGFDLSSAYHPRMIYPSMKKRWVVTYDGARQAVPNMKHNFADKEIRRRLTYLSLEDKSKAAREKRVENNLEHTMEKTVVREYYVPHGYLKRDEFGNVVVVNRLKDLSYGTSGYGNASKSPFPGAIPTIRATSSPFVSQREASRLVSYASKIIACVELNKKEKDQLMEDRYVAAGVKRAPGRSKSAKAPPRNFDDVVVTRKTAGESRYDIYVKTGDENGGSTEAPISITLFGSNGRSQQIVLTRKRGAPVPFQKGNTDKFTIVAPHVGQLQHIKIGHQSERMQDRWFLDSVIIHDRKLHQVLQFTCKRFLRMPHNGVVDLLPVLKSEDDLPKDDEEEGEENEGKTPVSTCRFEDEEDSSAPDSSKSNNNENRTTSSLSIALITNFFDAIRRNDEEAVLQFLTGGNGPQFIYCRNSRAMGPMHFAAMEGADNVLNALIRYGASVDSRHEEDGFTPLHYAAFYKQPSTIERLLSLGANPLALTTSNSTALHLAALSGHFATTRAALTSEHMETYNALEMRNNDGARPVDIARQQRFYDIEHFLNRENSKLEASKGGDVDDEYDAEYSARLRQKQASARSVASTVSYQPIVTIVKKGDEDFYKDAEV